MAVPNIFKYASGTVLLEELDTNFATPVTIGTTPVALGATVGSFEGVTLVAPTLTTPTLTTPALGTPASAVLTNCTDLPIATGVSGLAAGASTFLTTPSSANLSALLSDETGTGSNVFATSPTLTTPTVTALNGGQLAGLRNRIINGDMRVAQRGLSFTPSVGIETYTLDRWLTFATGAAVGVLRAGGPNALFPYALSQTGVAGNTACSFYQRVESLNSMSLSGENVTISAWLYSTDAISVAWAVYSNNAVDVSASRTTRHTGTIALSAGWNYTTLNIPAFNAVAASNGFQFGYAFPATLAGIVRAGAGVQIEVGSVATPFEQRPYGMELALCQRYYEVIGSIRLGGYQVAGNAITQTLQYIYKRAIPTSAVVTTGSYTNGSGLATINLNYNAAGLAFNVTATGAAQASDWVLSFSAEL